MAEDKKAENTQETEKTLQESAEAVREKESVKPEDGARNEENGPETKETGRTAESGQSQAERAYGTQPGQEKGTSQTDPGKRRAGRFFDFLTGEGKYIREQAVLSRIDDEHLMDYLALEQKRYESEQKLRDERGKRLLSAFQLAVSLAAIVAVIGFLKDEPTVLVNILYIIGIIAAIWLWKMKK